MTLSLHQFFLVSRYTDSVNVNRLNSRSTRKIPDINSVVRFKAIANDEDDMNRANPIKIHLRSGKISYLVYGQDRHAIRLGNPTGRGRVRG